MKQDQEHYRGCLIGGAIGDSDSTVDITGNIMGAYLGLKSIPQEWL
jgi:ADP-ribosylglycohydrolase